MCIATVLSCSQCNQSVHGIPRHYSYTSEYAFILGTVQRNADVLLVQPRVDVSGEHFHDSALEGSVLVERYGFWVDVTNKGEKPIRFLWPRARYIDETSRAHIVYHWS